MPKESVVASAKSASGNPFAIPIRGTVATTTFAPVEASPLRERSTLRLKARQRIENAVYAHIQALRALGNKETDTARIADALGLRVEDVNSVLAALITKGVKRK